MPVGTLNLKTGPWADFRGTILARYPYPRYWWLDPMTREGRQALMRRSVDQTRASKSSCLMGYVSREGELMGFSQAARLAWDSNHFGCEIWRLEHVGAWGKDAGPEEVARVLIKETIHAAHEQGCRSMQARIPVDNLAAVHALEMSGFRTMEVYSTWIFDLLRWEIPSRRNPEMIRDFRPSDAETLVRLARFSYTSIPDRFHLDPRLAADASDELYAEWIRNSCSGEMADFIAVAHHGGRVIGYATLRDFGDYDGLSNVRIAHLGLGAVEPDFRGRGLVSDLVIHGLEWLNRRGGRFAFISTQGNNIPAQRLFQKAGFRPAATDLTLHYWRERNQVEG